MNSGAQSPLSLVGGTPLVELTRVVPDECARILLKVEAANPTGSMKDRMALAMIEAAESDGRLRPDGSVVEYTAGSTGVSLAFVCAAKGYGLRIVTSDAFSEEKRLHMTRLGARLTIVRSTEGRMDARLTHEMVATARSIAKETGAFWTDQLNNADQLPAYHALGEEIWVQTKGVVDSFVQFTGTAASCRGVSEALRRHSPGIHCVAVEPAESAVLSGGPSGVHKIEGVGAGFVVPLWDGDSVDEVATASTKDSMAMARRLATEEGLFAGTSTGGNVLVAIEVGRRLGPGATVVTLMCDTGLKYLSTPLYSGT